MIHVLVEVGKSIRNVVVRNKYNKSAEAFKIPDKL